jgi:hypothetical protein
MLFDLRGRGRRRMVKVVYVTLAFLLGGGLVLFGIGGDVSGGLVDAITSSSGGTDESEKRARDNEAAAVRRTQADASDAVAWGELARARVRLASTGNNFDAQQGAYTAEGKAVLGKASEAWDKYIELKPKDIDEGLARLMVQAYSGPGLNEPDKAVRAQELVTEARPDSANQFAQLAVLAWSAGQTRKGDLARDKALELTDPDMRETVRGQLESAKSRGVLGSQSGG